MNKFQELSRVADIHAGKIVLSVKRIGHLFPVSKETVQNFKEEELLWIELLINRFGKLQDFLGSKLIDAFLEQQQENIQGLTVLDKLHRLERLEILESAELWRAMRETRNHISHEYPDHPELTALYLNKIFDFAPQLLTILKQLKDYASPT